MRIRVIGGRGSIGKKSSDGLEAVFQQTWLVNHSAVAV